MKTGFVNIFGRPNAGKSTLMNALLGEKLAIVSSKVQTTRHRIKGILNEPGKYQIIFSDTPGIINPAYKLQERMMQAVKSALEDVDVAILLVDSTEQHFESHEIFEKLNLKVPAIVAFNKADRATAENLQKQIDFYSKQSYCKNWVKISALHALNLNTLLNEVVALLPEAPPFYPEDELTDLPTKFFTAEIIREKIYELFGEEIPYHTTVIVNEFKEKTTLTKIQADIVVQRETQKGILLGEGGRMIKKLGTLSRIDIEEFLGQKVFLELFVKVKPKWREDDLKLKEYGY